ncbi:MAG TPA: hypothetical protein VF490_02510, partial [Chryseosolibacter sp.]
MDTNSISTKPRGATVAIVLASGVWRVQSRSEIIYFPFCSSSGRTKSSSGLVNFIVASISSVV